MNRRNEVLVCYDISDNKVRKKVYDELKNHGLSSIQFSVFWGEVNRAEERGIQNMFQDILDKNTDRAFILKVQLLKNKNFSTFGHDELEIIEHACI